MNENQPAIVPADQDNSPVWKNIGLALSGGGFRATMFHLGVLQFLAECRLLSKVSHICSVSGGSILAGDLGLKWANYESGGEGFIIAAEPLRNFIETGAREYVINRLPIYWLLSWLPRCGRLNATFALACQYRRLYDRKSFGSFSEQGPTIHILATNLTMPKQVFCFNAKGCERHPPRSRDPIEPGALQVRKAIAASSAFPGLFPPFELRASDFPGTVQEKLGASKVYLTDGGVYDNRGRETLSILHENSSFDLMFISDAGALNNVEFDTNYLRAWHYLPRIMDIMGERVLDLSGNLASSEECYCSIHTEVDNPLLDKSIQTALPAIRTDLDGFSKLLIRSLICHGFHVAKFSLSAKVKALIKECEKDIKREKECEKEIKREEEKKKRILEQMERTIENVVWREPYDTPVGSGDLTKDRHEVTKARHRSWKLWKIIKDPIPLFLYLAIVLCLSFGVWTLWQSIHTSSAQPDTAVIHVSLERLQKVLEDGFDPEGQIRPGSRVSFVGYGWNDRTQLPDPDIQLLKASGKTDIFCKAYLQNERPQGSSFLKDKAIGVVGQVQKAKGKSTGWEVREATILNIDNP